MCTAGEGGRRDSCLVPDPSEVFQTRRGGAVDPHTRLPGYTCSMMLGVTQVKARVPRVMMVFIFETFDLVECSADLLRSWREGIQSCGGGVGAGFVA